MKATVLTTSPGVGQLFAVPQKSFASIGAALIYLLRGLNDDVIVLATRTGDSLSVGLVTAAYAGIEAGSADHCGYTSESTPTTRTAYDWTRSATGASISPALPTMPSDAVSLQALIDNQFVDDERTLYIDQTTGAVAIGSTGDFGPGSADVPVCTLTLSSGNRWE